MKVYKKHYRLDTNEELTLVCYDCPPVPGNHLNPTRPVDGKTYHDENGKEFHLAEVKEDKPFYKFQYCVNNGCKLEDIIIFNQHKRPNGVGDCRECGESLSYGFWKDVCK